jgi:cation transport ATPase
MDRAAWEGILKQTSGIIIDELSSHGKVGLLCQGDAAQVRSDDAQAQPTFHPVWPVIGAFAPSEVASLAKAPPHQKPGWRTFLRQYRGPMQIVLVAAGVISGVALRQWGTALVLLGLTLFNALIGLRQEGKAEASVAALQKMLLVKVKIRRDGQVMEVPAEGLVPGDIVLIEAGDRVSADGRIIKAATLEA